MKTRKRLLSILLSLVLVLVLIPGMSLTAYAEELSESFETNKSLNTYTGEHFTIWCEDKGDNDGFYLKTVFNHIATISSRNGEIITKAEFTRGWYNINDFRSEAGTVTYDGDVATVTGINATSLTIGAEGGLHIKAVKVYWDPNPHVPVTSVTLNADSAVIAVNGVVTLTASVSPNNATDKKVKWSVSGAAVKLYKDAACTEEVGTDATETLTVYARDISAGSATVTATSNADNTKTASCAVTVNEAVTPVSGVTLNLTTAQKIGVNGSVAFTATVAPNNATDKKVKWSVNGSAVKLYADAACTVPVGTGATETLTVYAKGVSAGSATVTVTSNANSNKYASCAVTVQKVPHTGDAADFGLWAVMLAVGLAGMGLALTTGKRRKEQQ